MGLIKAALGAANGTLGDQWKEYFYCDSLNDDTLVAKGQKKTSSHFGRSSNSRGEDDVISNGSLIAVNEGQAMMIVEQGAIVEFSAEPGEFTYDSSSEPSIFTGDLKEGVKAAFETFKKRLTFGGDAAKDQRVYYFNTKEIIGNKYGTANPVPFRVVDKNVGLDVDISIRCNGEYSYKLTNPVLFYKNVCGNVADVYDRSQIDSQLKSELLTSLQPAFAKLSELGIRYSALPGHAQELADALNSILSTKWKETRGIEIASFGVNSVTASDEDAAMIKEMQKSGALRDPSMAAATLASAQGEAMKAAASNTNGAAMGFMGMNMAQNTGGVNANNLYAMGGQTNTQNGWKCECGTMNTGKFCTNCGKPQPGSWKCECGTENTGKFCTNCGKPKPESK